MGRMTFFCCVSTIWINLRPKQLIEPKWRRDSNTFVNILQNSFLKKVFAATQSKVGRHQLFICAPEVVFPRQIFILHHHHHHRQDHRKQPLLRSSWQFHRRIVSPTCPCCSWRQPPPVIYIYIYWYLIFIFYFLYFVSHVHVVVGVHLLLWWLILYYYFQIFLYFQFLIFYSTCPCYS